MSSLASPAYTDGLGLDTRGCRSSLKGPIPKVSKTLPEALLCDSLLDNRSLTPPIRQGTKEGPAPSPPEVTAPHQCRCGLPGRDGRRGARRGVAQAHRIPGDLLPHGPAGPAPVATGCGDARGPPDGLAANADHLRHPGQRRGTPRPVMADLGAAVVAHPTAGSAPPTRSWGSPRATRPRARARSSSSWTRGRGPRPRTDRTRRSVPPGPWRTYPLPGS